MPPAGTRETKVGGSSRTICDDPASISRPPRIRAISRPHRLSLSFAGLVDRPMFHEASSSVLSRRGCRGRDLCARPDENRPGRPEPMPVRRCCRPACTSSWRTWPDVAQAVSRPGSSPAPALECRRCCGPFPERPCRQRAEGWPDRAGEGTKHDRSFQGRCSQPHADGVLRHARGGRPGRRGPRGRRHPAPAHQPRRRARRVGGDRDDGHRRHGLSRLAQGHVHARGGPLRLCRGPAARGLPGVGEGRRGELHAGDRHPRPRRRDRHGRAGSVVAPGGLDRLPGRQHRALDGRIRRDGCRGGRRDGRRRDRHRGPWRGPTPGRPGSPRPARRAGPERSRTRSSRSTRSG